ncbi:MAG: dephospho-CoA kinase [Microthrixaceae bacterium]
MVVDAGAIVHELQEPGTPVLAAMVERFGPAILHVDGTLDRQAVAALVFDDPGALKDLGDIVHPPVRAEIFARVAAEADSDHVVVLDIPLLAESGWEGLVGTIVVDLDPEVAVRRLVEARGFEEADARRIARQATRAERLASASFVIDNSGSVADLAPNSARAGSGSTPIGPRPHEPRTSSAGAVVQAVRGRLGVHPRR